MLVCRLPETLNKLGKVSRLCSWRSLCQTSDASHLKFSCAVRHPGLQLALLQLNACSLQEWRAISPVGGGAASKFCNMRSSRLTWVLADILQVVVPCCTIQRPSVDSFVDLFQQHTSVTPNSKNELC